MGEKVSESETVLESLSEDLLHLLCPGDQVEGHHSTRAVSGSRKEGVEMVTLHQLQLGILGREVAIVDTHSPAEREGGRVR